MRLRPAVLALLALAVPATAHADKPTFNTVKLPGASGSTEPRIAVGRDDARWAVTNGADGEIVYVSRDKGATWTRSEGLPPQKDASIDVDIVTMPTGRILSSELDYGGLNFPTGYSDDQGKTWTESVGSTELADQDRQWFAVGPVPKGSPKGTQPPVYLLYHNFASGVPQHNMWVATSNDGGATFGPPVPSAQPGSDAYTDLQCSDSGGPSNITVNPKTGHIYVVFTTRAGVVPGTSADTGGCGASVFGPLEFNIVNGTRVWVADSPDGSPGSWNTSLAVDRSDTQQVVSQQLAYGALDNQGNFYVAYPESPKPYPNIDGSGIRMTWQEPLPNGRLDTRWSKPVTLVPYSLDGDTPVNGSTLVHLVAGDPGKLALAYFKSETVQGAKAPVWYTHVMQVFKGQSQDPKISDFKVAGPGGGPPVPTYQWTNSQMMGICSSDPVIQGVENGLRCSRSTDVWGITLDQQCRVSIVWPARGTTSGGGTKQSGAVIPNNDNGTFVTTQTGGDDLCGSKDAKPKDPLPGGSLALPWQDLGS